MIEISASLFPAVPRGEATELLRFHPLGASGRCLGLGFGAGSGLWGSFFELESDFSGGLEFEEGGETFSFFGDEAAEEVRFTGGAEFVELFG